MSVPTKLYDNEIRRRGRIPRYRLAIVLFCVGLALAIACAAFTPAAIGNIGSDQTFPLGL
jgi:hypothetical protein